MPKGPTIRLKMVFFWTEKGSKVQKLGRKGTRMFFLFLQFKIGFKGAKQNSLLKTKTNLLRQNMGYTRKTNLLMQKRSDQANSIDLFRLKMSKRDNSGWYWTKKEAKHLIRY